MKTFATIALMIMLASLAMADVGPHPQQTVTFNPSGSIKIYAIGPWDDLTPVPCIVPNCAENQPCGVSCTMTFDGLYAPTAFVFSEQEPSPMRCGEVRCICDPSTGCVDSIGYGNWWNYTALIKYVDQNFQDNVYVAYDKQYETSDENFANVQLPSNIIVAPVDEFSGDYRVVMQADNSFVIERSESPPMPPSTSQDNTIFLVAGVVIGAAAVLLVFFRMRRVKTR